MLQRLDDAMLECYDVPSKFVTGSRKALLPRYFAGRSKLRPRLKVLAQAIESSRRHGRIRSLWCFQLDCGCEENSSFSMPLQEVATL